MARVVITIEDQPNGTVKVVAEPNFATMAQMTASGHELTSAHGYALRALNSIREAAKEQSNTLGIIIPRIGR
jgi:hypothetical protein